MKNKILLVFLAVTLVTALVVAGGCAPPEEPTAPVEPIKIGAPIPLTGLYAADGEEMRDGLTLVIEDINAQGGVLGRPLELVTFDIKDMLPEDVTAAAYYLVLQEKVDLVATGYADYGADIEAFGKYDVPYLHGDTTRIAKQLVRDNIDEYWNVFMTDDDSGPYGWLAFKILTEEISYEFPNKRAAIIAVDYDYNLHTAETFRDAATNKGWEIVVDELVPFGVKEWGPILTKIRATEPSIILFSNLVPIDGVTFLHQFLENPTNSLIYATYFPSIPEFIELAGDAANGVMWITAIRALPGPKWDAWSKKFEERFGYEPAIQTAMTHDMVRIWVAAVERVGDVSDYRAISQAIVDYTYTGLCGTYSFDPEDQHALVGEDLVPPHFVQIQDGEHILLWPERFADGEFQTPPWIK